MRTHRAKSSSAAGGPVQITEPTATHARLPKMGDGLVIPSGRPRADSAPMPMLLGPPGLTGAPGLYGTSMMSHSRLGVGGIDSGAGLLEQAMSVTEDSGDVEEDDETEGGTRDFSHLVLGGYEAEDSSTGFADHERLSDMAITIGDASGPLEQVIMDDGSDVDEEEMEENMVNVAEDQDPIVLDRRKTTGWIEDERRSSADMTGAPPLDFTPVPFSARPRPSALTAALNRHIPHLVSTSSTQSMATISNPFASLYASVSAPPTLLSLSLELYFPHSADPSKALVCKVRKDATVEEVTGYGLFRFWEEAREPRLSDEESEQRWSTVRWGLRIVEDDGEVDEDFPRASHQSQAEELMCTIPIASSTRPR